MTLENTIKMKNEEVRKLDGSISDRKAELLALQENIAKAEAEKSAAPPDGADAPNDKDQKQVAHLEEQVRKLQSSIGVYKKDLDKFKLQTTTLDSFKSQVAELQSKLDEEKQVNRKLKNELHEAQDTQVIE